MNTHTSLIITLITVIILTACAPAQVPPTPTVAPTAIALPSPTATETLQPTATPTHTPTRTYTPKPTLTLTPTLSQFPLLELLNKVKLENGDVITQTDSSLENLIWPGGIEDFAEEPYVNIPQGFQIQYPKDWVVLENPDLTVFSPDKMHTLCHLELGIDRDQCGTPVAVAVITNTQIIQYFREMPLVKPGEPEPWFMSEYYDNMILLEMGLLGATPYEEEFLDEEARMRWFSPERFEINGFPAIGMGSYGGYQRPGDPPSKKNPVIGYLLVVREKDRVAMFFSMAPAKFWEQYKTLLVTMMQSFEFTAGPLPPTPTSTPTPTLIPAPAKQTPTAERFMFNGMELEIREESLGGDCLKAFRKICPDGLDSSCKAPAPPLSMALYPGIGIDQPKGTNCLLVVISSIPGKNYDISQFEPILKAAVVDQTQKQYSWVEPLGITMEAYGEGIHTGGYIFVDLSATSFKLLLPDGQEIPLSLAFQPPTRLPTASPVPTFTPLANLESYNTSTPQASAKKFIDEHGVEMVYIPAGDFRMGRSSVKQACLKQKGLYCDSFIGMAPEHTVTLDAFYMDVLEVTNARYAACAAAGVCVPPESNQSATRSKYYGNPQFDDYPVVFVDWQMARTYCQWRNGDLPTEAQWEKAARGNDNRWFPWGDVLDDKHANFNDVNSSTDGGRKDLNDGYADTAPANSYPEGASPYGILNLAGNVWEWVLDDYSAVFYEESPRNNPIGLNLTGLRVIRGGSWSAYEVLSLWVSYRDKTDPREWDYSIGFRCVRTP